MRFTEGPSHRVSPSRTLPRVAVCLVVLTAGALLGRLPLLVRERDQLPFRPSVGGAGPPWIDTGLILNGVFLPAGDADFEVPAGALIWPAVRVTTPFSIELYDLAFRLEDQSLTPGEPLRAPPARAEQYVMYATGRSGEYGPTFDIAFFFRSVASSVRPSIP